MILPNSMGELSTVVQQFTRRYRAAHLRKAAGLAVLVLVGLGVLWWRLQFWRVQPVWRIGIVSGIGGSVLAILSWWLRRAWLSPRASAAHLDDTLGMEQRLITAEEFARQEHPPALYPLLVEDAARHCSMTNANFPRLLDRTSAALALVILFLLLLPRAGVVLDRIASPPPARQPPNAPEPPNTPPDQQGQQDRSRQPRSTSPQAASPQTGQQSQGANGASSQSSQTQSGGAQPSSGSQTGQASQQSTGSGGQEGGASEQPGSSSQPQAQSSSSEQQRTGAQQRGESGQQSSGQAQQGAPSSSGETQAPQAARQNGASQPRSGQQHSAQPAGSEQQKAAASQSGSPQQAEGQAQSKQGGTQQGKGSLQQSAAPQGQMRGGSGTGMGDQEAMKAEIQGLLKQVSGELKDLQAQLAKTENLPKPEAGTTTDPNLYEAPAPLEQGSRGLPVQLRTDQAAVKTPRQAGGIGKVSTEASPSAPQVQPEQAELSSDPLEETSTTRQSVPPEYRGVFDRLRRPEEQPQGEPSQ